MASAAPKKKGKKGKGAEEFKPVVLGRPGNNVKMGIVGMPNIGKSLLFNTLSGMSVPSENYPFCTIEPTTSRVAVPDLRFEKLCEAYQPAKRCEAFLTVIDIAGLVKGAAEGAGLGNEFLSNIMAVDGIFHVVRAFEKKKVEHVEGDVNPSRDLEIISNELRLKDIEMLKKVVESKRRVAVSTKDKRVKDEFACLEAMLAHLEDGKDIRNRQWNNHDIEIINTQLCLSAKPVVYLVNVLSKDWTKGAEHVNGLPMLKDVKDWVNANAPGSTVIPFCARFEAKCVEMKDADEREKLLKKHNVESKINDIIHAGYSNLQLIHYFTSGADEVKCWTIRKGTNAKKAAKVIHTDIHDGFICAETMAYVDFEQFGSEADAKANGRYRTEGRDYIVQDGDILYFKHNSGGGAKKKK